MESAARVGGSPIIPEGRSHRSRSNRRLRLITMLAVGALAFAIWRNQGLGAPTQVPVGLYLLPPLLFGVAAPILWLRSKRAHTREEDGEGGWSYSAIRGSMRLGDYRKMPAPLLQTVEEISKKLNIENLDKRIAELYSGNETPAIEIKMINENVDPLFAGQVELCLLQDQQILDLKLHDINQFGKEKISILQQRLICINQKHLEEDNPTENWTPSSEQEITLCGFRKIHGDFLFAQDFELRGELYGLLTSKQVHQILEGRKWKIDSELIGSLLPISDEVGSTQYTEFLLRSLSVETIAQHCEHLSGPHLRLCSPQQMHSSRFPWELIALSEEKAQSLFKLDSSTLTIEKTKRLLRGLSVKVIPTLAKALSGDHLRLLSDSQLQDSTFPWEFIANSEKKIQALFKLDDFNSTSRETKRILQLLGPKAIQTLAQTLSGDHLRLLSDSQLQDPRFPWELIASSEEKVQTLFKLDSFSNTFQKTKCILQLLGPKAIQTLAQTLSGDHLRLLSDSQLQDPRFPWELIANSEKKIQTLFKLDSFSNTLGETKRILQLLGPKAIQTLATVLTKHHRELLSETQRRELQNSLKSE